MPIFILLLGVLALLILVMRFHIQPFLALVLVALGVGLAMGMPINGIMESIQNGVGSTLGYLALVLGFGSMLGALISESGAADRISGNLINKFGKKRLPWAMVITGFIIGIPMFYTVGFIMLIPLIFTIYRNTRIPILLLAIPMVSALSVTHGFLPPHPAPTAIAVIYKADITTTLLYGLILAIPTIIIAGPIFSRTLKNIKSNLTENDLHIDKKKSIRKPSFGLSVFTALFPVILMTLAAVVKLTIASGTDLYAFITFIGEPITALLIGLIFAFFSLGVRNGMSLKHISGIFSNSVKEIAVILLIIGAGGAFKQVLIDSGLSDFILERFSNTNVSPLVLAWVIAASLRIALGSATVAALTAAGIASPLIGTTEVSPELLVLVTGAGSLTFSQVNDTGFWLFKEYFKLSIVDTFKSWTAMETIVSLCGLVGCLLLDLIV
ncbi:MAG TPA: gluconate:H+ symporter [Cyclobacteriaceae bacterium]